MTTPSPFGPVQTFSCATHPDGSADIVCTEYSARQSGWESVTPLTGKREWFCPDCAKVLRSNSLRVVS